VVDQFLHGVPDSGKAGVLFEAHTLAGMEPPAAVSQNCLWIALPPGCPCCAGALVFRTRLNALLRQRPTSCLIALSDATHAGSVTRLLATSPYPELLACKFVHL